jgi:hypothetical protein
VNSIVPIASGATLGITTPNGKFYNVLGTLGGEWGAGAFLSGDPNTFLSDGRAIPPPAIPESSTIVLAGCGVIGLLLAQVRRRHKRTRTAR